MTITVVIPAYNEEKLIGRTLDAIHKQTRPANEVIVINASSTDNTASVAKQHAATVVTIPKKTIGFGRQAGLEKANGDVVVFTDADTVPPRDWLSKIETYMTQSRAVGVFGGYRFYDGPIWLTWFTNYVVPFFNTFLHWVGLTMATGQNMAFYKNKALEVGGFPVDFKISEDIEMARRLKKVGKILYNQWFYVTTSGRRGHEGFSYLLRLMKVFWYYLVFRKGDKVGFPDIR